jgi:hypothetical protein
MIFRENGVPFKEFYTTTKDYRIDLAPEQLKQKTMRISTPGEKFFVTKIAEGLEEKFQFSLEWYPNCSPVPSVLKEFMCHKEITMSSQDYIDFKLIRRDQANREERVNLPYALG